MFHSFSLFIPKFHLGLIWSEVKQLWDIGLHEYVNDMWNVIDFVTNSLYVATVALRVVSYFQVTKTFVSIEKSVVCSFVWIRFISFHFVFSCAQFCCAASVVIFTLCLFSKLWHNWKCNLKWCWMLISVHTNSLHVCRMFVTIVCCRYKKKWCTINMQRICRVNSGIHGIRCCYQVSHLCIMYLQCKASDKAPRIKSIEKVCHCSHTNWIPFQLTRFTIPFLSLFFPSLSHSLSNHIVQRAYLVQRIFLVHWN